MKIPRTARRAATAILVVAAAAFLGHTVWVNSRQIAAYPWRVNPALLALSVVAHVAVLVWGVWVWSRVLRHFEGDTQRFPRLLRVWFFSNLARYIPGFQFLAAAQLSRADGFSGMVTLASMLVHTGLALLSALVVSAWTLQGQLSIPLPSWVVSALATIIAVALVHPAVLNASLGVVGWLSRRAVIRWNGSWAQGVGVLALCVVSWGIYGVAYHLFLTSLTPLPARILPQLAGVNALSFVAGFVVIFVPGGWGVREVTMAALLRPYMPDAVAVLLSVGARLWTITAELLGGATAVLVARAARQRAARDAEAGGHR